MFVILDGLLAQQKQTPLFMGHFSVISVQKSSTTNESTAGVLFFS